MAVVKASLMVALSAIVMVELKDFHLAASKGDWSGTLEVASMEMMMAVPLEPCSAVMWAALWA